MGQQSSLDWRGVSRLFSAWFLGAGSVLDVLQALVWELGTFRLRLEASLVVCICARSDGVICVEQSTMSTFLYGVLSGTDRQAHM